AGRLRAGALPEPSRPGPGRLPTTADRARWSSLSRPTSAAGNADDQRVTLATATAQRGGAHAAAAALEFEGEMQHDPGPGQAGRVAERERAAVDVDLGVVEAELAGRLDADGGKR